MDKVREFLRRLKNDKKALITVFIGLFGMLLILLSELPDIKKDDTSVKDMSNLTQSVKSLQNEVEDLLSKIDGAGKVDVLLTFEEGEEKIFAKNTEEKSNGQQENESTQSYITVESGDGEDGLLLKVIYPKVRGVAVVCTGGNDIRVKSEITALLSALFDIGSNRISVACGKPQ
ncbi:MAG: stage III sporulation protein AG [Acutalibacteraceae bacterium]